MACLDNPATDGFKTLFMTPLPFEMKFDLLIQYVYRQMCVVCIYNVYTHVHATVLKAGHPGVLLILCLHVVLFECSVLGLAFFLLFLYNSHLHCMCYAHVFSCTLI